MKLKGIKQELEDLGYYIVHRENDEDEWLHCRTQGSEIPLENLMSFGINLEKGKIKVRNAQIQISKGKYFEDIETMVEYIISEFPLD